MLGLAPPDPHHPTSRRFITRMPPPFGRPHHPYAAMMYPEFGYRPPPPSYQASMQEYRLRLLLLDRHHQHPMVHPYHTHNVRGMGVTMGQESNYSHPPSYHSRDGSISQNPDVATSNNPSGGGDGGGGGVVPVHSREPSNLSFLSESIYSHGTHPSQNGSQRHVSVVLDGNKVLRLHGSTSVRGNNKKKNKHRDDNTVTIVQTTDSSQVIGSDAVIVTVSGSDVRHIASHSLHQRHHNQQHPNQQQNDQERELSVLAHL
ncbi:unnamed protein product [Meganyctiphanes norvegica]|uniref:Uncharacterized protein n=1 Tax=Meganyctiphanes norvegica TaxID=48144 RepID=A0AAV2QND0_MEGNR